MSIWRFPLLIGGFISLGLGLLGIITPVLPTTPFLLLAAFCFSKSSPRFHKMLLEHSVSGPIILAWQRERAIPKKAKIMAMIVIATSLTWIYLSNNIPSFARIAATVILLGMCIFILSRPFPKA